MKLELKRHIFQKYTEIKFKDNPSMTGGQAGMYDEVNRRFSQICERTKKIESVCAFPKLSVAQ